jgi:hypothetical protein
MGSDIARSILVNQVLRRASGLEAHHRRQGLVADHDPLSGVLGQVPVLGHDHGNGLAGIVHFVLGQHVLSFPRAD